MTTPDPDRAIVRCVEAATTMPYARGEALEAELLVALRFLARHYGFAS